MRRRELLGSVIPLVAFPLCKSAAQPKLPNVGYLSSLSPEAETQARSAFLHGLERAGFVDGRDVAIQYRFAEGRYDRLPSLAAELAGLRVAVLVATGAPAAQ